MKFGLFLPSEGPSERNRSMEIRETGTSFPVSIDPGSTRPTRTTRRTPELSLIVRWAETRRLPEGSTWITCPDSRVIRLWEIPGYPFLSPKRIITGSPGESAILSETRSPSSPGA